jgi:DNA polymerase III epsilon subunit-like protein
MTDVQRSDDGMERIWVLDTESNGQHPAEIIELAAVEMVGMVVTGRYRQWRFRPRTPITRHATMVHGIRDRDLRGCARIETHAAEIAEFLGDHPIAGHAVNVELDAVARAVPGWAPRRAYDTLRIARRAMPDLERHRLSSVGEHLGLDGIAARITSSSAHSALYDAVLCALILRHVVDPMTERDRRAMLDHADVVASRRRNDEQRRAREAKRELRRLARAT